MIKTLTNINDRNWSADPTKVNDSEKNIKFRIETKRGKIRKSSKILFDNTHLTYGAVKVRLNNEQDSSGIEMDSLDAMEDKHKHFYGSPAIWLKEIKRGTSQPHVDNRNIGGVIDTLATIATSRTNSIKINERTRNISNKKIYLYSKQPSFIMNNKKSFENIQHITMTKHNSGFKSLIFKRGKEKKFSNINQGSSKISLVDNKEIDEMTGSFMDLSYKNFKDNLNLKQTILMSSELKLDAADTNNLSSSDSVFKTMSQNVNLDPYLNKVMEGKIKWRAGEIIAEGTSSVVYKALNEEMGNFFVVKRYLGVNQLALETFQNEVKIYSQLDHPHIIKFLDSEVINNNLFIYLEYMSGGSIRYILDRYGPLNENLVKIFLRQILEGLSYLHSKGICHRDIKSANILLDINGKVKLSDFGCSNQLVSLMDSNSCEEFMSSLKGTLPWMAPEVICQKKYGKKADIWSLGCTLIEIMTGNPPWGKLDNCYHAITRIGKSNDIPEIPSHISETFKDFILLCLKRDPNERANLKMLRSHPFVNE